MNPLHIQEQAAIQAHLTVSAIMRLFECGDVKKVETRELEALIAFCESELRERDGGWPDFDSEPF